MTAGPVRNHFSPALALWRVRAAATLRLRGHAFTPHAG